MKTEATRAARLGRSMTLAISCTLGSVATVPAFAQELRIAADGRLHFLANLYADETVANLSQVCIQRFPETKSAWAQAQTDFHQKNRQALAELAQLQAKLTAALRAKLPAALDLDTLATIVYARMELLAVMGQLVAPMNDAEARKYCDDARALYANDPFEPDYMRRARTAAAAAVEDLSRR